MDLSKALAILSLFLLANAQYSQDYLWTYIVNPNGDTIRSPLWIPRVPLAPVQGYNPYPETVFLEYNCFHMADICTNAINFLNSDRGQARDHPYVFGYDLNSDHSEVRREQSCPKRGPNKWADRHPCPEFDQSLPMRRTGRWWTTALEFVPPFERNQILSRRDPDGNIIDFSGIRWSCDEFPPATWVEGGTDTSGRPGTGEAKTRCAAIGCQGGVLAEQNWQGLIHKKLRSAIIATIGRRLTQYTGFDRQNSVVLFNFRMNYNSQTMSAARVITYTDFTETTIWRERSQRQRSSDYSPSDEWLDWMNSVKIEDLHLTGNTTEHHVHAEYPEGYSPLDKDISLPLTYGNNTASFRTRGEEITSIDPQGGESQIRRILNSVRAPLYKRASPTDLESARKIVEEALKKAADLNAFRYAHPLRNQYMLEPGTVLSGSSESRRNILTSRADDSNTTAPPLLEITDEIAAAAALVAEADAVSAQTTRGIRRAAAAAGSYWMGSIARRGTVPWGDDPSYKIFRNVLDYGAVGDGTTDDTAAIKKAMQDGNRCGKGCNGSTTKNAIVYFPPGKYLISSTIPMPFGTQVIGDGKNWPTLVASKSFLGLAVLSADEYTGGGTGTDGLDQQYYVNTANFYRQVRNIRIDITQTRSSQQVAGLHYQVAQATSLQNIEFIMASGTKQRGIFAENGSGGVMSDLTFRGGAYGIYGGNQQFTAQRITFDGCSTGVQLIWDWGWVWKSITMKNADVGFRLLPEDKSTSARKRVTGAGSTGNIGSAAFMDSSFTNVATAVLIGPPNQKAGSGSTGIVIENVAFSGVTKAIADTTGVTVLAPSSKIDYWALGPAYSSAGTRTWAKGKIGSYRRQQSLVDSSGNYFERPKPQYEDRSVGDFIHTKDFAKGDGSSDDTVGFQKALNAAAQGGKILFVDAGSYLLTGTVTIPINSKIVGETWSQLVASGSYFSDASNPKVMLKVGNAGEVGSVEMQDLIFTTRGPTAGAILVEWNVRASSRGAAALWDCHARIGGATGTQLTPKECPASTTATNKNCNAASLMMHLTTTGSGYFENMWLWVSDHMIDDPDTNDANNTMVQNSVYVARGFLIESQEATWLYGTASEHSVYYQYNFNTAKNVFAGLLQTESPYYQPNPKPPAPFTNIKKMAGDPDYACAANDEFSGCDESWAVIIRRSGSIMIGGAGLYSWFSSYTQSCIDSQTCQKALVLLKENFSGIRFNNLITIGAKYMLVQDGKGIKAADNLNVNSHPYWSQISVYDVSATGVGDDLGQAIWIDPKIWDQATPSFSCSPPCTVMIPPWTSATRTVNYPLLTVSDASGWTSTITKAPLTLTELMFKPVTITANTAKKRGVSQGFSSFLPVPATTPYWPAVTYTGPDGSHTVITPTIPFPPPPSLIGAQAAPPADGGSWPGKRWIVPISDLTDSPTVDQCYFNDFSCLPTPWEMGGMGDGWYPTNPDYGDDDDGDDGDGSDEDPPYTECPMPTRTSTSSTTTTTPDAPTVTIPTPLPEQNEKHCYTRGRSTNHESLDSAIASFCSNMNVTDGTVLDENYTYANDYPFSGTTLQMKIKVSLKMRPNCVWTYTKDECKRYLELPVDACDCNGVNGKHGGYIKNNCMFWNIDPNTVL